mmetsp:Transcript_45690/g.122366  ORF Transcript_45690/g.122366 Transcript_45690/m.122366 type:complete len:284 (-) Transcript_45690:101-952(-)
MDICDYEYNFCGSTIRRPHSLPTSDGAQGVRRLLRLECTRDNTAQPSTREPAFELRVKTPSLLQSWTGPGARHHRDVGARPSIVIQRADLCHPTPCVTRESVAVMRTVPGQQTWHPPRSLPCLPTNRRSEAEEHGIALLAHMVLCVPHEWAEVGSYTPNHSLWPCRGVERRRRGTHAPVLARKVLRLRGQHREALEPNLAGLLLVEFMRRRSGVVHITRCGCNAHELATVHQVGHRLDTSVGRLLVRSRRHRELPLMLLVLRVQLPELRDLPTVLVRLGLMLV